MSTVLSVSGLGVDFDAQDGAFSAVDDVSFAIGNGESLGLTGEAGSGKSVVARAVVGLAAPGSVRGRVLYQGSDLLKFSPVQLDSTRGNEIGYVPQQPMPAFDPDMKVGDQIAQSLVVHIGMGMGVARKMAVEALHEIGIVSPKERAQAYPAQLSPGERQRAVVARALICEPRLLVADEPAIGMNGAEREHLVEILHRQRERRHMSLLLVSQDLSLISDLCDTLAVMQAGLVVEQGRVADLLEAPRHPYTAAYMAGAPLAGRGSAKPAVADPIRMRLASGCRYAERCSRADQGCRAARPPWSEEPGSAGYRCIHPLVEPIG